MSRAEPPKKRTGKSTEEPKVPRFGRDGRLQMLVYMSPKTADDMKGFAIDDRRPVSDIVEELVEAFLAKRVKPKKSNAAPVARVDRRQVLLYMSRDNIRELKRFAMAEGRPAYIIIEKLVEAWLKKRRKQKSD
jgi:hypothetical protein